MNKTILAFLVLLLAFSAQAASTTINTSFYIQNGFDSQGKLLPAYQPSIDRFNSAVQQKIPSFLLWPLNASIRLDVTDSKNTFLITVEKGKIVSIQKNNPTEWNAFLQTDSSTLNQIFNSKKPLSFLKKSVQNNSVLVSTNDWQLRFLFQLFTA